MSSTDRPTSSTLTGDTGEPAAAPVPAADDAGHEAALLANPELVAETFGEYVPPGSSAFAAARAACCRSSSAWSSSSSSSRSQSSVFLSAGNLTNLLTQSAVFILLGMAEVFVLLLGEIDLSIGYVAGVGAVVTVSLTTSPKTPWRIAILAGLAVTTPSAPCRA